MSIFCSIFDIGFEHKNTCARMRRIGRKAFIYDESKPCTCGSCPIVYRHSGVFPRASDERSGHVDLAAIPTHITRDGKDDGEGGYWHPWLRFGVNNNTVLLTLRQAETLRNALTQWLDKARQPMPTRPRGRR